MNTAPIAFDDDFNILENHLELGINALFGNLFDDNGNGADFDPDEESVTITALNGIPMMPNGLNQIGLDFANGSDVDVDVDSGVFGFFIGDIFDHLPAGVMRTETFTYTIEDAMGASDTATVSITITGIDSNDVFNGTGAADTIRAGVGHDIVRGVNGNDRLFGDNGNDKLFGGNGLDFMRGGNNHDQLRGENHNDRLFGDGGNDVLIGGLGRDIMNGGAGRDRFDYDKIQESRGGLRDRIDGFQRNLDDIDLRTIDADVTKGGNQRFKFIGDDAFTRTAGELHYRKVGAITKVEGDINGDGRADFTIDLTGVSTLKAGDFFL